MNLQQEPRTSFFLKSLATRFDQQWEISGLLSMLSLTFLCQSPLVLSPPLPLEEKCTVFRTSGCMRTPVWCSRGGLPSSLRCPRHPLLHTLLPALLLVDLVILISASMVSSSIFSVVDSMVREAGFWSGDPCFSEGGSATCIWALKCLGTWLWGRL